MVRRGSTVRVRQRALQKPRITALFVSDRVADSRTWARYGALYGAFRSKTPTERAARPNREAAPTPPNVRGFKMSVHAAARWYSWISPPSRSRRLIPPQVGGGWAFVESGESSASPR